MNRVLQFLSDRAMEYFSDRVALRIRRIIGFMYERSRDRRDFVSVIPRKGVCGRVQQPVQSMLLARTSNCDAAVAASRRLF